MWISPEVYAAACALECAVKERRAVCRRILKELEKDKNV